MTDQDRTLDIAIITPEVAGCYTPARIGEFYFALAVKLTGWGHRVTLVHIVECAAEAYDQRFVGVRERHERAGVTFVAAPDEPVVTRGHGSRQAWIVDQWLSRHRFDVVHVPDLGGFGYYAMTARSVGRRYRDTHFIVTAFGSSLLYQDGLGSFVNDIAPVTNAFFERTCLELADEVIVTSDYVYRDYAAAECAFPARHVIEPVLLGVDSTHSGPFRMEPTIRREIVFVASQPAGTFCEMTRRILRACDSLPAGKAGLADVSLRILSVDPGLPADRLRQEIEPAANGRPVNYDWVTWQEAATVLSMLDCLVIFPCPDELAGALQGALVARGVPVLMTSRTDASSLLAEESRLDNMGPPADTARVAEKLLELVGREALPRPTPAISQDALWEIWRERHRRLAAAPPNVPPGSPRPPLPLVSACITHFQRSHLLSQALQSVQDQTYPNIEIIVVDDGSRDQVSKDSLARLEKEWQGRPLRIVRQENLYQGAARNAGALAAKGDYVLFLDDDDAWKPDMVSIMVAASQARGADIVTSFCERVAGEEPMQDYAPDRFRGLYLFTGADLTRGIQDHVFGTVCALIRRKIFDTVRYTQDFGIGYEDKEFFVHALFAGFSLICVPDSLFWYRDTAGSMTRGATRSMYQSNMRGLRPYLKVVPAWLRPVLRYAMGCHLDKTPLIALAQQLQQEHQRAILFAEQVEMLTREVETLRRKTAGWN